MRQPARGLAAAVAQTLGSARDAAVPQTTNRSGQGHPLQTVGVARGGARVAARLAVADHRGGGFHASADSAVRVARAREAIWGSGRSGGRRGGGGAPLRHVPAEAWAAAEFGAGAESAEMVSTRVANPSAADWRRHDARRGGAPSAQVAAATARRHALDAGAAAAAAPSHASRHPPSGGAAPLVAGRGPVRAEPPTEAGLRGARAQAGSEALAGSDASSGSGVPAFDPAAAIARRAAAEATARAAAAEVLEAAAEGRYVLEASTRCGMHPNPSPSPSPSPDLRHAPKP